LGVSADGSVVVGYGTTVSGYEAFRWTAGGGLVGLGDLPGEPYFSGAFGISDDGTVVVGSGNAVLSPSDTITSAEAFRWTAAGGMVGLGHLPGENFVSVPEAVSADGSVVVGYGNGDFGDTGAEAFRWTSGGGMVGLGDLPGGIFSSAALDVSADGSVVVGVGATDVGRQAFLWTAEGGIKNLRDLLLSSGATGLTGWTLRQARGVSADGRVISGFGINPRGQVEAWIATIAGPVLPGDFNNDGSVDAADYVVWRKGLATAHTQNDYDTWRAHFGQTAGSGAALPSAEPLPAATPEPPGLLLVIAVAALAGFGRLPPVLLAGSQRRFARAF
jgi:probable HAF family extracellular repeat protein